MVLEECGVLLLWRRAVTNDRADMGGSLLIREPTRLYIKASWAYKIELPL